MGGWGGAEMFPLMEGIMNAHGTLPQPRRGPSASTASEGGLEPWALGIATTLQSPGAQRAAARTGR